MMGGSLPVPSRLRMVLMDSSQTGAADPAPPDPLPLLAALPEDWWPLLWPAHPEDLNQLISQQAEAPAQRCLALAIGLWLAGETGRADDLLIERDARQPELGLVPDPWGLLEDRPPAPPEAQGLQELLQRYLALRHGGDPGAALSLFRERLQQALDADPATAWRRLLEPPCLGLLALLLAPAGAAEQLRAQLEPPLMETIGEAVVASDPDQALLFWSGIVRRCPGWDYARLKTADLSLQCGAHQHAQAVLAAATEAQQANPWLHDIQARLALAQGQATLARDSWDQAISAAAGDPDLVELLRQRRRDAEWHLELAEEPTGTPIIGDADLELFSARLDQVAGRYGIALPPAREQGDQGGDPDAFAAFLDRASGRLALAG
jgi:hypothetical protein